MEKPIEAAIEKPIEIAIEDLLILFALILVKRY